MKRIGCLYAFWAMLCSASLAAVPGVINFQGRLFNGTNLYNGTASVRLRIFDGPVLGSILYEDSNSVTVVDGLYSTYLGDNTIAGSLDAALASTNAYLEIVVDGSVMSPRERIAAVAYALKARDADSLGGLPSSSFATTSTMAAADNSLQLQIISLSLSIANLDSSKVNRAGDTMTGALVINDSASSSLRISSTNTRIAIGAGITNQQDQTALLRGSLFLEGATGVYIRPIAGSGPWSSIVAGLATGSPVYVESDPSFTNSEPLIFWRDGSRAMTGNLDMGGHSISNISLNSITFTDGTTISAAQITNWDQAYTWGNHAAAGYATGSFVVTESDPVWSGSSNQYYQKIQADAAFAPASHGHSGSEITDGTISLSKLAQNGATNGQIMKWSGSAWLVTNDAVAGMSSVHSVDDVYARLDFVDTNRLAEIITKLIALDAKVVGPGTGVAKTGQTVSHQIGDDGDYEKGIAPPVPRFTVQANTNVVIDNMTGLMWTRNADLGGSMTWSNAIVYCEALNTGGFSDWRLPNLRELHSLVDYGYNSPALTSGHPFANVLGTYHWTSSTYPFDSNYGWFIAMYSGDVSSVLKSQSRGVWPVRGGP